MTLLWDRPIAKSARVVGATDQVIFLGGPELSALDLKTRKLLWATRLPGDSSRGKCWLARAGSGRTRREESSNSTRSRGRVRKIFRGDDTGSDGGDLYLTNQYLLAITNRTISAYSVASNAAGMPGKSDESATNTKTRATND